MRKPFFVLEGEARHTFFHTILHVGFIYLPSETVDSDEKIVNPLVPFFQARNIDQISLNLLPLECYVVGILLHRSPELSVQPINLRMSENSIRFLVRQSIPLRDSVYTSESFTVVGKVGVSINYIVLVVDWLSGERRLRLWWLRHSSFTSSHLSRSNMKEKKS